MKTQSRLNVKCQDLDPSNTFESQQTYDLLAQSAKNFQDSQGINEKRTYGDIYRGLSNMVFSQTQREPSVIGTQTQSC